MNAQPLAYAQRSTLVAHVTGRIAFIMMDPQELHDYASHVVLHAWIGVYLREPKAAAPFGRSTLPAQLASQAIKLRESTILLAAALEKMRVANEKLALRMAEHKAFFAKYKAE